MATRKLRYDTDEILRKVSKEVDEVDNKVRELAMDMVDTMYKYDGIGLAAPQVGVLKRILVYDVGNGPIVCINPKITKRHGKQCGEEGCLSFPNTFGTVERPQEIWIEYFTIDGNKTVTKEKGIGAVVFSHELDHLDGVLFIDKANDLYTLTDEEIKELQNESNQKKGKNKHGKK